MLEVLIVIAILGILISIAIPAYENYRDKQNITTAKADILEIQGIIDKFYVYNNRFPTDLSEINQLKRRDPWGNPYLFFGAGKMTQDEDLGIAVIGATLTTTPMFPQRKIKAVFEKTKI